MGIIAPSPAVKLLKESRVSGMVSEIEAGRPVDFNQAAVLSVLDLARMDELFLLDRMEAESDADEEARSLLDEQ